MLRLALMPVRHHAMTTPDGRATALISDSPTTDTAIIFVHGFRGHCTQSWQYFQVLIDNPDLYPEIYGDSDLHRASGRTLCTRLISQHKSRKRRNQYFFSFTSNGTVDGTQ